MSPTRRALLSSLPVGALAGCLSGALEDESESDRPRPSGTDTDPTVLKVRNPNGDAVVFDGAETNGEGDSIPIGRELVTSAEQAANLLVADGVADADRRRIRSFLDETDFDAETVYVARAGIESCLRLRIRSVSWQPGRIEYEYCRELRPPDEACEAETRVPLALVFRLPVVIDGRLNGSGSSGRSPCRGAETDYAVIEGNATVPGNETAIGEGGDGA
ncbi:hypothetical protein [Halorubrum sp. HHNYT27]|uniref:hypothetical protein n=1 Tax=Halorubrum sp. HHNYT27 TaxID=3402275 RepID=UPI003EB7D6DE